MLHTRIIAGQAVRQLDQIVRVQRSPRIVADSEIAFGKPTISGTRVPVGLVVGKLGGGMSVEQVMDEYVLEHEDVLAALTFAARPAFRQRRHHVRATD